VPKVFVTGGTGHVGANLVRGLLERGEDVRALVRRRDDVALRGVSVEQVEGDLSSRDALAIAMRGCDRVYHLAASISLRPGDRKQIFETNVRGTKHVLDAAEQAGVRRVVFCSSFGAIGHNPDGASDESHALNPFDVHLDYDLSKSMAELEVLRAVARGLDAVIVNPSGVIGPHDYKPSSVGQSIIDFAKRRMPAYVPGAFEFVAVRDVVAGHLAAMERGVRGHRYILSGEHLTLDAILDELSRLTGVRKPRLKIPTRVMLPIAHLSSAFMSAFLPHVPPRFTPGTIKLLDDGKRADIGKARRELGYAPTSVFAALREQVEFLLSSRRARTPTPG
jgi:hopanoid-associated sugar epimerase